MKVAHPAAMLAGHARQKLIFKFSLIYRATYRQKKYLSKL